MAHLHFLVSFLRGPHRRLQIAREFSFRKLTDFLNFFAGRAIPAGNAGKRGFAVNA
jgi:hypothetical protein